MTRKIIKKIPMTDEKVIVVHDCTMEPTIDQLVENITKLSVIITGNGDPEKGICRKVALIEERQGSMCNKIDDIHESLKEYHQEVKEAKQAVATAQSGLDKYMASVEGKEKGKKESSTKSQVTFNNIINVIGTIVIIIGLVATFLIGKRDDAIINQKIDNFGTPVIVDERGMIVPLPPGDSLKYYRDGKYKEGMRDE